VAGYARAPRQTSTSTTPCSFVPRGQQPTRSPGTPHLVGHVWGHGERVTESLVIVNPYGSRVRDPGARAALVEELRGVLGRRDGRAPSILETASQEETRPAVDAAVAAGAASVVGVGGDGTLREIAAGLAGSGIPLGIVPGGTGNLMAGILGVPTTASGAVAALARARPRTIDIGQATLRLAGERNRGPGAAGSESAATFAIGCGAGFDARVMATTPPDLKRRFGKTAYFAQAFRLALEIEAVPFRITVDGDLIETDASIALITNMGELVPGFVGPRLPIVPDDGLLDLIVVGARGPLHGLKGLVDQLYRTRLGGGSGSDSLRIRAREIDVVADRPEPLQVDGDHVGWGSLSARVLPGALDVLVPA
jgi:diacylglycerol kinase (ATP)